MEWGHIDKSFELAVDIAPDARDFLTALGEKFHEAHERAYGYSMIDQPIQSVYLGATALIVTPPVKVDSYGGTADKPSASPRRRSVLVGEGRWADAAVLFRRDLPVGFSIEGPAIIEEPDSTTYVPPGYEARVHPPQCLILTPDATGAEPA
jgi:N-methylhydantoinase A